MKIYKVNELAQENVDGKYVLCLDNIPIGIRGKLETKNKLAKLLDTKKKNLFGAKSGYLLEFPNPVKDIVHGDIQTKDNKIFLPQDYSKYLKILSDDEYQKLLRGELVEYKGSKILNKILDAIGFKIKEKLLDCIHFDIDKNSSDLITYYPINRAIGLREDQLDPKQKQKARTGRILRKLDPNLIDNEIEKFVNKYKAYYKILVEKDFGDRFKVVRGKDIKYWYLRDRYSHFNIKSELWNSCMSYHNCQKKLKIYTENPDKVALAIYLDDDDKLLARALIWKLDDGRIYMDRIYAVSDTYKNILLYYAEEKDMLKYPRVEGDDEIRVSFDQDYGKSYKNPYMDTFEYFVFRKKKNKFYLTTDEPEEGIKYREYDDPGD